VLNLPLRAKKNKGVKKMAKFFSRYNRKKGKPYNFKSHIPEKVEQDFLSVEELVHSNKKNLFTYNDKDIKPEIPSVVPVQPLIDVRKAGANPEAAADRV